MRHFLKKVDLYLRNVHLLCMNFRKILSFMSNLLKKVDLELKHVDLCIGFLKTVDLHVPFFEKNAPRPEKQFPFTYQFHKKIDLKLKKIWNFTYGFLKVVDLNLKIVALNAWPGALLKVDLNLK